MKSKSLPGYEQLSLIMQGHVAFQMLWAGVELGIFDCLSKRPNLSEDDVGTALGLQPRSARVLLTGLRALQVVEGDASGLRNSIAAEAMLTSHSETSWARALGWQRHIVYPGAMDFVAALKQGTNVGLKHFPGEGDDLYTRLEYDPQLERVFQDAMSDLSTSANELLLDGVDLSQTRHLVDLGGGDGTNAIAFAQRFPHLRVTLFDRGTVCAEAKAKISEAGLSERVSVRAGDLFTDALPQDADAMLLAHMLTIWSPPKNIALLRRVHDALPSQGQALVFNMMADDDGAGPIGTALGSLYFLTIATGEGMLYRWNEYELFLREAGLLPGPRQALPRDHGLIVGTKT
ncbi:MAG: methyltransferase domain-containing protein [Deltaproteobacteria bacterium]|nr:methyltransferase domain-containing protein [Deltaproteobacteria bacterium]